MTNHDHEREAKARTLASMKRRTQAAFKRFEEMQEELKRRGGAGHPSREPDRNQWGQPDGPCGR